MNEDINWLEVVLNYAKRFPTRTVNELGLEFHHRLRDTKLEDLKNDRDGWLVPFDNNICVFSTMTGFFKYNSICNVDTLDNIIPVPDLIKLRLLTEGKEDLI